MPIVEANQQKQDTADTYAEISLSSALTADVDALNQDIRGGKQRDANDFIVDILEYDVPYHVRVSIDLGK
jgi:DNA polymerase epsilon subunit 1